jgi:anti-anti-sigma factor
MPLEIQVVGDLKGKGYRVALRGRLDTVTAPELDNRLAPILANPAAKSLVFDLAELEYISSAGVQSFVRARKALEGRGGSVALLNPRPPVKKVFDILKAMPAQQVFSSVAELDRYLDSVQRRMQEEGGG